MYPEFTNVQSVTPYGVTMLVAALAGWLLSRRRAAAFGVEASHLDIVLPLSILAGVGMAALVSAEGAVRLVSVVGFGAVSVLAYSLLTRVSFARLADVMAVPTLVMIALQRVGCFLAGCCWGDLSAHPELFVLGVSYPPGSLPYDYQAFLGLLPAGSAASLPVYPVQLYELSLVLGAALALGRTPAGSLAPGAVALWCTIVYATIRIGTEFLRGDVVISWMNLTSVQWQCLVITALAMVLLATLRLARSPDPGT
jgi:phosphatidylglycerol:prolipoprotein diacylglycerol transferase